MDVDEILIEEHECSFWFLVSMSFNDRPEKKEAEAS